MVRPTGEVDLVDPHTGVPDIPPRVADLGIAFAIMMAVIIVGWPLARALGRRIERRAETPPAPDPMIAGQLQRIEQAVEAMAIEIERISEGQRFTTRLLAERADSPISLKS